MSNLLQTKKGAVFFVDILGFAALTQNKIQLTQSDYKNWKIPSHLPLNNQTLAATILVEFRKILFKYSKQYPNVTIAQLSDCAFVWSENIKEVIVVACNIMWDCVTEGILCRSGLSCGEIIETSRNNDLGRLLLGEAVSNAARLEQCGAKGMRIMMHPNIPEELYKYDKEFYDRIYILFQPFENPLDYQTYDELKWYYVPNMNDKIPNLLQANNNYKVEATKTRLKLAAKLRLHPRYSWNERSREGQNQLISSIRFISANEQQIFKVNHFFDWSNLNNKRDLNILKNIEDLIDNEASQYSLSKDIIVFPEPE